MAQKHFQRSIVDNTDNNQEILNEAGPTPQE